MTYIIGINGTLHDSSLVALTEKMKLSNLSIQKIDIQGLPIITAFLTQSLKN